MPASITTTTNTTAAAELLAGALGAAWQSIRAGMDLDAANEYSEHYSNDTHIEAQRLREAGEAAEAAVGAEAERLGISGDVLYLAEQFRGS